MNNDKPINMAQLALCALERATREAEVLYRCNPNKPVRYSPDADAHALTPANSKKELEEN